MATSTQAWTPPTEVRAREAGWTPCECGCGVPTPRRFRPGHDAKLKGELIRTVLRGEAEKATEAEREAGHLAEHRIRRLGWEAHLVVSRESVAKRKAARRKPAAEPTAPTPDAPPATEGDQRTAEGGTIPASVRRLSGKVGRRPRQS